MRAVFAGPVVTRAVTARAIVTRPVITGAVITRAIIADASIPATVVTGAVVTGAIITPGIEALLTLAIVAPIITVVIAAIGFGGFRIAVDAIIVITVTPAAAFGLAIAVIAEQAKIMFGILQIIFCRHPVAGLLGIARQSTIFFQQLGGIAALAIIEPGAVIIATSHLLRARPIVAATAPPPLVVPDQDRRPRCLAMMRPLLGEIGPLRAVLAPAPWTIRNRPSSSRRGRFTLRERQALHLCCGYLLRP